MALSSKLSNFLEWAIGEIVTVMVMIFLEAVDVNCD